MTLETYALTYFQNIAPRRTGKLKNSIVLISQPNGFEIDITAPHTVYTEEAWVHPRWRGRKNPNEAWIKNGVELLAQELSTQLGETLYVD